MSSLPFLALADAAIEGDIPDMGTPPRADHPHSAVGERLVEAREALGMTQPRFRQVAGATKSVWSRFETGERLIRPEYAQALYEQLGVDAGFIYHGRLDLLPEKLRNEILRRREK